MSHYIQTGLTNFIKQELAPRHDEEDIKIILEIINIDHKATRPETRSMKSRRKQMEEVAVKITNSEMS